MTSEGHMPGPVCLIENVKGQLIGNQEALRILSDIKQPVVVVAIVGFYRTGKSYLMNKLAGKQTGFSLGCTVQSHTKGIWMWCVPHPQFCLTLRAWEMLRKQMCPQMKSAYFTTADLKVTYEPNLLTQVCSDFQGDNQNDCWIIALAVLLSSTFVYNSMGAINQQAMDQLHYVTELTDRIRSRSSPDQDEMEDSEQFVSFFPDFVWALRDFSLELKLDGKPISADEYLENSLKLIQGTGQKEKEEKLNLPWLCIRKFFPKKKCFVFERPAHGKKLGQLESLQDQDLDSDFVEQVAEFCSYVFNCSQVKTILGGIKVNGPRLKSLVVTYVNTINSGSLPCMENAVLALSHIENAAAVRKAMAHYDQQMTKKLQLPTETLQELMDMHRTSEKEAIKIFMENSFKDVNQVFLTELASKLETKQGEFYKKNLQASSDRCSALLRDIFGPLEEDVKQGVYYKQGGYCLFNKKIQKLKKKYYEEPRKGLQAEEALQKFLQSKEDMIDAILQTDQTLTEKEREIEVQRAKAEAAEVASKMMQDMQKKNDQLMKEQERSYEDRMKELAEKMEKEQAQMREEQQKVMEHKLREQAQQLNEKFQLDRKELQNEIRHLNEKQASRTCVIS